MTVVLPAPFAPSAIRPRPGHRRAFDAGFERAQQPDRRRVRDDQVERAPQPTRELIAQPVAERAVGVEPHDVAQVAVHVLVILGPCSLTRTTPRRDPVDVFDDALNRFLGGDVVRGGCERLDVLEQGDEVVRVSQQDLVQLTKRARCRVEEDLTAIDGAEPVGRK
jgi:hypothetical protein